MLSAKSGAKIRGKWIMHRGTGNLVLAGLQNQVYFRFITEKISKLHRKIFEGIQYYPYEFSLSIKKEKG